MKTATTQISSQNQFAGDSAKLQRAQEKFDLLAEATLDALRQAGQRRHQQELQEQQQRQAALAHR